MIRLIFALLFTTQALASFNPITIKPQDGAKVRTTNLQVPANQATETAASTHLIETGNKNLLVNPGFEHSTPTTGWTITATGDATCNTAVTSTSGIEGENQFLVLTANGGASGGTCSIKQEVSANTGMQALVGAWFLPEALGSSGGPTTVVYTLVNGSRITERDISNTGTSASWQSFFVPEVANTTIGVEALITVAASTEVNLGIEAAVAKVGDVTQTASIITPEQSYTPTFTGFGTVSTHAIKWRQNGGRVEIYGRLVAGTVSATELRLSLPSGYTASSSISTIQLVGYAARGNATSSTLTVLAEPSASYVTFGIQNSSTAGLTKATGSGFMNSSEVLSFFASIPVNELSGSTQVFASNCGAACENVLSAKVSSADAVSDENVNWINGNCTNATTGRATCVPNSGTFSVVPNCTCSAETNGECTFVAVSSTTVSLEFRTEDSAGSPADMNFTFSCQKQGADYTSSRQIVGSFKEVVTAPGITKPKTCYAAFGGASATLASPTLCTTGTCVEIEDTCGAFTPPSWSATGNYGGIAIASGTFANSTPITCDCQGYGTTTGIINQCETSFKTSGQTWSTNSNGGGTWDAWTFGSGGSGSNSYFRIRCQGQAP